MKSLVSVALLLCFVGVSYQLTTQQIIKEVNIARTQPLVYAAKFKAQFTSLNKQGPTGDLNCYTEAESYLRSVTPLVALKEDITADLASWRHSYYLANVLKTLSHYGANNTSPYDRLMAAGTWTNPRSWTYNENIAWSSAANSAEFFVMLWIGDCGITSRGHRKNIFSTTVTVVGCADVSNYLTCVGAVPLTLLASAQTSLAAAGLSQAINGVNSTCL